MALVIQFIMAMGLLEYILFHKGMANSHTIIILFLFLFAFLIIWISRNIAGWIAYPIETLNKATNIELIKFKKTLDMTLDCVLMFDAETFRIFYVNQGAINQLGYQTEELLQMTLLEINPYFTQEQIRQFLNPLVDGSQPALTLESIHQHKNTTLIQVETFFQYIEIPPTHFFKRGDGILF